MSPSQLVEIAKLTQNVILLKQTTEEHLASSYSLFNRPRKYSKFPLMNITGNLPSVNSEKPFDVRHYLSKTLQP